MDIMAHQGAYHFRVFFAIVTVLCCMGCFSSDKSLQEINTENVTLNEIKGILYANKKPLTGVLYQLSEEGDTIFTAVYENGVKNGIHKAWWPNGQLKFIYHFRVGEFHGNAKEWNKKGLLVKDFNYRDGHESGPQKLWYKNGKIKANYEVINGRRYGLFGEKGCINEQNKANL